MTTFIDLVNNVIDEGKISVDALTSANFDEPPRTAMYNRIKRWINVAYKELAMSRPEWYFRKERGTLTIWPRLHLSGLSGIPAPTTVLRGLTSGVLFTVMTVYTFEEVDGDPIEERTVGVQFSDDTNPTDLILGENIVLDSDGTTPYGSFKGFGRYDFHAAIAYLESIDPHSVRIFDSTINDTEDFVLDNQGQYLVYVPYEKWNVDFELDPWSGSYPLYITETPQGTYDFYPKFRQPMLLTFDYTRVIPASMVDYDDEPEAIPSQFHDYLTWRALEEFADFDNNRALYSRAHKHVIQYEGWLHRDQLPEPKYATSKFDGGPRGGFF